MRPQPEGQGYRHKKREALQPPPIGDVQRLLTPVAS